MSTYAVADLHGNYELFQMIKDFIKPEDVVYVIGDCIDRGKNGMRIALEIMSDPRFIYIKGNHEDMFVKAIYGDRFDKEIYFQNGGKVTYRDWKYKTGKENYRIIQAFSSLPLEQRYVNTDGQTIIMCHAGYTPHVEEFIWGDDLLWSRDHFNQMWDMDFENSFMVHGHTPVPGMDEYLYSGSPRDERDGILWYCPDDKDVFHKCDIDCGTAYTGMTALLDLDTFEHYVFKGEVK